MRFEDDTEDGKFCGTFFQTDKNTIPEIGDCIRLPIEGYEKTALEVKRVETDYQHWIVYIGFIKSDSC